ncbi:MAG: SRPBCC family protein [Actinomycetota bacterium]
MAEEGSGSIEIRASPERIMGAITDIEAYPSWMSPFKKALVLERDEQGRPAKAEFAVDARLSVLNYTLAYRYLDDGIAWDSVAGDVKQIAGSYSLEGREASTNVTYSYLIDPGFPVPGFIMRKAVKALVSAALEDLKKRVESPEG